MYKLALIFHNAAFYPFETPLKMQDLIFWTRTQLEEKRSYPLLVIGVFIVIFLAIHPFQDGNGRLSRLLTMPSWYRQAPLHSWAKVGLPGIRWPNA